MSSPSDRAQPLHVLQTLGQGPSGSTFRVLDPDTGDQMVARRFASDPLRLAAGLDCLVRDARLAMPIRDPRLVAWSQVEVRDGCAILLRPWVADPSLLHHARFAIGSDPRHRGGHASPDELLELCVAILEALDALHERGLVARRLSPGNVFPDGPGRVRLTDWGVRLPRRRDAGYESPEQLACLPVEPADDLHALATLLFEIGTGRVPQPRQEALAGELEGLGDRLAPLLGRLLRPGERSLATAREALRALDRPCPRLPAHELDFRSARLIGREGDLEEIGTAITRTAAGQGEVLFVRGEAGIGKTRLLERAARLAVRCRVRVLAGAHPESAGFPLGRVAPWFHAIARDMAAWTDEEVQEALQGDGRVMLEVSPDFHALPFVRRLPEPPALGSEAAARRLFRVAARVLSVYARRQPVLLLADDLDSADALTVEFIRYLARRVVHPEAGRRPAPVLVLAAYEEVAEAPARGRLRPAVVALRARGLARELAPKPLAPHELRDLLLRRLDCPELPAGFVARTMDETGGNPLKVEEALAWLATRRVLDAPSEDWSRRWEEELAEPPAPVPEGQEADEAMRFLLESSGAIPISELPAVASQPLLGRRLREVSPATSGLLQAVALSGHQTSLDVLRMASGLEPQAFEEALVEARAWRFLVEDEPGRVAFRHPKLRDAVVAPLDANRRRTLHARIGLAIEQHVGSLDERTPLLLAHHAHLAGHAGRSLLYLPLAARIYKERHASDLALLRFQQFFRHLQALDPSGRDRHLAKRLQALQSMAETLADLERRGEASNVYREMAALAEGSGREPDLVGAWSGLAALSLADGDLDTADRFARRAIELARGLGLALAVAANLHVAGTVALRRRRHDEAVWQLTGALKVYREQGDALGAARTLLAVGDVYAERYDHRRALAAYRKSYAQFRQFDDKVGVSAALNRLGRAQLALGDASRALAYHREALRLEREADDREGVGGTLDLLGEAYRERGDLERAAAAFREALALKRELADVRGSADSLLNVAHVSLQAGRLDEAPVLLEQALTLARRTGNARAEAGALQRLAQAHAQRGELERAVELAEDALARAQACGDRALECRACLVLAGAAPHERAMEAAVRGQALAETVGFGDLLFRAHVRLGDLLRHAGEEERAFEHYGRALDVAGAHADAARSARDGFLRRSEIRESLRGAAAFVATRTPGDVRERFPVLRYAPDEVGAAG